MKAYLMFIIFSLISACQPFTSHWQQEQNLFSQQQMSCLEFESTVLEKMLEQSRPEENDFISPYAFEKIIKQQLKYVTDYQLSNKELEGFINQVKPIYDQLKDEIRNSDHKDLRKIFAQADLGFFNADDPDINQAVFQSVVNLKKGFETAFASCNNEELSSETVLVSEKDTEEISIISEEISYNELPKQLKRQWGQDTKDEEKRLTSDTQSAPAKEKEKKGFWSWLKGKKKIKKVKQAPEKNSFHLAVLGARKIMATIYQSCSVLALPTFKNTQIIGIAKGKKHSRGGYSRHITSLANVQSSHYYLKHSAPDQGNMCIDIQDTPPLYDFGGKPFIKNSVIDLFKNDGSGTSILGVDCSGFITSALFSQGLRLKKGIPNKAFHIHGIYSALFKDVEKNKLTCFQKVSPLNKKYIQEGDLVASSSHILMIYKILNTKDPFGIEYNVTKNDCDSITYSQFQFEIIQSSPAGGGIGVNRMHIKDFTNREITRGLEQYASSLCHLYQGINKNKKSSIAISRHLLTNDCLDNPIPVIGSECTEACLF